MTLIEWLSAREVNCRRLAERKTGEDRIGWLDDADYFAQAVAQLHVLEMWMVAQPLDEWNDDFGFGLWFEYPIVEPPYVGSPNCDDWPGYHTHFVRLRNEMIPQAKGKQVDAVEQ